MTFQTGQFILLGLENKPGQREYSVFSGENDYLEVLIREVEGGKCRES